MFSPFCTLSQSRKISSPPSTEPHVLSIREIFRLEAFGDSAGKTHTGRIKHVNITPVFLNPSLALDVWTHCCRRSGWTRQVSVLGWILRCCPAGRRWTLTWRCSGPSPSPAPWPLSDRRSPRGLQDDRKHNITHTLPVRCFTCQVGVQVFYLSGYCVVLSVSSSHLSASCAKSPRHLSWSHGGSPGYWTCRKWQKIKHFIFIFSLFCIFIYEV